MAAVSVSAAESELSSVKCRQMQEVDVADHCHMPSLLPGVGLQKGPPLTWPHGASEAASRIGVGKHGSSAWAKLTANPAHELSSLHSGAPPLRRQTNPHRHP